MSTRSALVVLHPAGRSLRGDDRITSANVGAFVPAPEHLDAAMQWFSGAGFEVVAPGPNSFAINGDPELFSVWLGSNDPPFSLDRLPPTLRQIVAAVEVSGPPDFGPGNP